MNVGIVGYGCDRCGQHYRIRRPLRFYQVEDGRVAVARIPAWCSGEGTMTEAEAFASVETIEAWAARFEAEHAGSAPHDVVHDDCDGELSLDDVRRKLRWRRARRAARRCLECGSFAVRLAPDGIELERFEHPGCGGCLAVDLIDFEVVEAAAAIYDAEGNRIS